jgi:hypothetical protein
VQQRVTDFLTGEKRNYSRNDLLKHNFKFQNTAVLRPRDQWFKHCKYWACQSVEMDSKTKLEIKESDFANFQVSNIQNEWRWL